MARSLNPERSYVAEQACNPDGFDSRASFVESESYPRAATGIWNSQPIDYDSFHFSHDTSLS